MTVDDDFSVAALLRALGDASGAEVPTGRFGRLRRMASAALRTGTGVVAARLRGRAGSGLQVVDAATIEKLVVSLGELKGVAMKLGQILSYVDESLPPETARLLSLLQTRSQPIPFAQIEKIVRADLGTRADALLETMAREPVSTASIGQVHRAALPDGAPVAVKVRHPGIEAAIDADFRSAQMGKALANVLAPGSNVGEVLDEARARFLEECDYGLERAWQEQFAALYADHASLRVPAVHDDWCSGRVLTTTWHAGRTLDAFAADASPLDRDVAARALYEFYIGTLYRYGLFNADPHPGNLLFADGGLVTILDHGCVRQFDPPTVGALAMLSRTVRRDDAPGIRASLRALGARDPDGPGFEVTREMLRAFFEPTLHPGVRRLDASANFEMRNVLRSKRAMLRLQLPAKLLFLFRIRFGLYAVLSRLGAELDWQALEAGHASAALTPPSESG